MAHSHQSAKYGTFQSFFTHQNASLSFMQSSLFCLAFTQGTHPPILWFDAMYGSFSAFIKYVFFYSLNENRPFGFVDGQLFTQTCPLKFALKNKFESIFYHLMLM